MEVGVQSEPSLAVMNSRECMELLALRNVGNAAFTADGSSDVFPVIYVLDGTTVMLAMLVTDRLRIFQSRQVMALQVDVQSHSGASGWTVLIVGTAEVLTGQTDRERAHRLGLTTSADRAGRILVRITPGLVTGRTSQ